jgi:hypothetical protein
VTATDVVLAVEAVSNGAKPSATEQAASPINAVAAAKLCKARKPVARPPAETTTLSNRLSSIRPRPLRDSSRRDLPQINPRIFRPSWLIFG